MSSLKNAISALFLSTLANIVVYSQPNNTHSTDKNIEADEWLDLSSFEQYKSGSDMPKGSRNAANSKAFVSNFLQKESYKQICFDVKIKKSQLLLVEILDEQGKTIELFYKEQATHNAVITFIIRESRLDLAAQKRFVRVTADQLSETHPFSFN